MSETPENRGTPYAFLWILLPFIGVIIAYLYYRNKDPFVARGMKILAIVTYVIYPITIAISMTGALVSSLTGL